MPVNDFEKKVQQRMDEFRLKPSASVWPEVEKRIRDKKRRRIIFFWLSGLIGLGLTGYVSSIYFGTNKNITETNQKVNSEIPKTHGSRLDNQTAREQNNTTSFPNTNKGQNQNIKTSPGINKPSVNIYTQSPVVKKITEKSSLNVETVSPSVSKASTGKKDSNKEISISTDEPPISQQKNIAKDKEQESLLVTEENNKEQFISSKDKQNEINKKETVRNENTKDSAVASVETKKQKNKTSWRMGFHFSMGPVFVQNTSFPRFDNRMADYVSAGSGQVSNGSYRPAPQHFTGPAFSTGIFAEKNFSKRSSVSAGLQYTFISDRISNGLRRDTNTNHFHLIELPVTYQWQVNKGKRAKLFWNVGLMPGVLIHTNGVIYDTAFGGVLYKDAAAFNRFHISAITSFYLQPSATHKWQWHIGPEFRFGLTALQHDPAAERKYYFYTGIDIRFSLPRKK